MLVERTITFVLISLTGANPGWRLQGLEVGRDGRAIQAAPIAYSLDGLDGNRPLHAFSNFLLGLSSQTSRSAPRKPLVSRPSFGLRANDPSRSYTATGLRDSLAMLHVTQREAAARKESERKARRLHPGQGLTPFSKFKRIRRLHQSLGRVLRSTRNILFALFGSSFLMLQPAFALQEVAPVGLFWKSRGRHLTVSAGLFLVAVACASAKAAIFELHSLKLAASQRLYEQSDVAKIVQQFRRAELGVIVGLLSSVGILIESASHLFGGRIAAYATSIFTLGVIIFCDALPKSLAAAQPESLLRWTMPFIRAVSIMFFPFSWFSRFARTAFSKVFAKSEMSEARIAEQAESELRQILDSGAVGDTEQDMMEGALDLKQKPVSSIMTPRVDIDFVDGNSTLFEVRGSKYSRLPVCAEGVVDNIFGIVKKKQLIEWYYDALAQLDESEFKNRAKFEELKQAQIHSILEREDDIFVPECTPVFNVLKKMQRLRLHMLIVVDETGGVSGIVTLEEILELLVGEIYDEDDMEEATEDSVAIQQVEPGIYFIDGCADLTNVAERFDLEEHIDEKAFNTFKTVSGYLCDLAGEIPKTNRHFNVGPARFEVVNATDKLILQLRLSNVVDVDDAIASIA